jgi:HEAT repeat protein
MLWWHIREATSRDATARKRAVEKLRASGDARAVEALAALLRDDQQEVADTAAAALGAAGDRHLKVLIQALEDTRADVRLRAARTIGAIAASEGLAPVLRATTDREEGVRKGAIAALAGFGESAVDPLLDMLLRPDSVVREAAAEALAAVRSPRSAAPLLDFLLSEDEGLRQTARRLLGRIDPRWRDGTAARASIATAIAAISHNSSEMRTVATNFLGEIDPGWRSSDRALQECRRFETALRSPAAAVRGTAAEVLEVLGWRPVDDEAMAWQAFALQDWETLERLGEAARAALMAGLSDAAPGVRHATLKILSRGATNPPDALGPILSVLGDGDAIERDLAGRAIAAYGAAGVEAVTAAVRDDRTEVRAAAVRFLGETGDSHAIGPLLHALEDPMDWVRQEAVDALNRVDAGWRELEAALPVFAAHTGDLHHSDRSRRTAAAAHLGTLGWVPGNDDDRLWLALALEDWKAIERAGAAAAEPILQMIGSWEGKQLREAVRTLRRVAPCWAVLPGARAVLPVLLAGLADKAPGLRREAAAALGDLRDVSAVDGLTKLLVDADQETRTAASSAMLAMGEAGIRTLLAALRGGDSRASSVAEEALASGSDPAFAGVFEEALSDESSRVCQIAARQLRKFGWSPQDDAQGARYALALEDYGALADLGEIGREALIGALSSTDVKVAASAAGALEDLGWLPPDERLGMRYALLRGAVGELAKYGARTREPLLAALSDADGHVRRLAAEALARLGDPRALDGFLRPLFADPEARLDRELRQPIEKLVPFSALTAEIAGWALEAAAWDASDDAVRRLCSLVLPVTSNLLHLVAEKGGSRILFAGQRAQQRDCARTELKRRNHPPYRLEAYLKPVGAELEASLAATAEAAAREKQRDAAAHAARGRELLGRLSDPKGEWWEIWRELAVDHGGIRVVQRIVQHLCKPGQIPLGDLMRYTEMLIEVGQRLDEAAVRDALAPLRQHWPKEYKGILDVIEARKKGGVSDQPYAPHLYRRN